MENTNQTTEEQVTEAAKKITELQSVTIAGHTYHFKLTTRALRMVEHTTKKRLTDLQNDIINGCLSIDDMVAIMLQGFLAPLVKEQKDTAQITEALMEQMIDDVPGIQLQVIRTFSEACVRLADIAAASSPNR